MTDKAPLAGQRSPRWAFMERFEVPDYDDPSRNYLTRWRLIQTPWFGIYLHRMDGPDPRETLHDHPWNFVSLILRGGYRERFSSQPGSATLLDDYRIHRAPAVNRMRVTDAHYIQYLLREPTWTLMFVGRRQRRWGYWDRHNRLDDVEHRTWTAFDAHPHNDEFDRAMAWRAEHRESR